ncbi:cardiolipin synthase [Parelusimicrobium proximum]|uniref:cardiolipin synthase n=1 Tax=Parelusimicrobium proximum TaxID=3228953 RepID=UPI003D175DD3
MAPENIFTHIFSSYTLAVVLYVLLSLAVTCHILLNKRNVHSAIGWIGLAWLSPVFGAVIYTIFGVNRIQRKAGHLRAGKREAVKERKEDAAVKKYLSTLPEEVAQIFRLGHKIFPSYPVRGNKVKLLTDGDEAYPEMLKCISEAKEEILFASYIFYLDKAGEVFAGALKEAAERGVKVYLLVDGVGSGKYIRRLRRRFAGVKNLYFSVFLPVLFSFSFPFINLRNHRKMIVIDGKTAFLGGMNIQEKCYVKECGDDAVQDITFKILGPLAEHVHDVCRADWNFASSHYLAPRKEFDATVYDEKNLGRIIEDGPDSEEEVLELLCIAALNFAKKKITIINPYFLPGESVLKAVEMTAMKGVEVNIIIPELGDHKYMTWAMEANYERILACGANIYLSRLPFDHSKSTVVDGAWVFVGSANWDERSFKLNFECNIELMDRTLAKELDDLAEKKKALSKKLSYNVYKNKPLRIKIRNNIFRLMTPYL